MKLKFVADSKDVAIFVIFAIFLLYVVALGVLNFPTLAGEGKFYGLNPFPAFGPDKITYTLFFYILAVGGLFMSVSSYFFEMDSGFGISTNSSGGGYSRWAKAKEIKEDKTVKKIKASDSKAENAGVPLISDGTYLWIDDSEYHTLVIGATGSGKTQSTILPTVKSLAKKGESIICTDPKGEIYEKTGSLLKAKGYNIILLNFRNPQNGNAWNPLTLPYSLYKSGNQDKSIELLDDLALNILYEENSGNSDPFWEKTAADYFSGIALGMFEDTTEDKININSINLTATVGEDKFGASNYVKEYFAGKDPNSPAYINASGTVMAPSETKGGIISVFKQKVKLFASRENLSEMLSYSDFDMQSIGKQPTAVFIIIQDEKKTYHSLATIFVKQVYETLIDVAQQHGGKLPCRTNFLMDEFANMPPLKDVTTMITAARSRQIRFTMIIQNFAQLTQVYGKENAETIKGNCGNIIYLISTELAALEEISKLCGEKKSKKDDKTASTPLVTISDLQRMKQFDQIILRMRKNPFKTSFVPDFRIDWGGASYGKVDYPVREKKPVQVFDIRDFVKEKKNQKINEMMANMSNSAGGAAKSETPSPFPKTPMSTSVADPLKKPAFSSDLSADDIVKKIDEKLAQLEKEEKDKKEKAQGKPLDTVSISDIAKKETKTFDEFTDFEEVKPKPVKEPLLSSKSIEDKVNQKLEASLLDMINKETVKKDEIERPSILPPKKDEEPIAEKPVEKGVMDDLRAFEEKINQKIESVSIGNENLTIDKSKKEETLGKEERQITYKPTPTIKLDDAVEDDKFFDDFFDD